jgi:Raf kinase inhibitor-like YbhB/YbcL family protein
MEIKSTAFSPNGRIPEEFTCMGKNINPELAFIDPPVDAKSLALVMDDPDAPSGTFTHWVIYNIPPEVKMIPENTTPPGLQAKNGRDENRYTGPCPPNGEHRYFFKLYALDKILPNTIETKEQLQEAMSGHILDDAELMGLFSKTY